MKAVAASLFVLAVLMVFAAVKGFTSSDGWAGSVGGMLPAVLVIYVFLRVARECYMSERSRRERQLSEGRVDVD
jgi:hypothetical protein